MFNKRLLVIGIFAAGTALVAGCNKKEEKVDDSAKITTLEQKVSYIIGHNMAKNLKQNGVELDEAAFLLALNDAKAAKVSRISEEDSQKIMNEMQEKVMKKQEEDRKKVSSENIEKGKKFLEENKAKEGVKTTESGLQYKIITEGKGVKPKVTDTVTVHYAGKLIDGTEFDSSAKHGQPATFPLDGVIPGWTEVLQLMPQGSKWEVYIPSELAYGEGGQGPIPASSTLIFEIELLEVKAPEAAPKK
jgi:FKBP-type peptidyl-prolyl cis-trans isomerase FkpA